jgi:hypothetical protein
MAVCGEGAMKKSENLYVGSTSPFGPGRMAVLRQLATGDYTDQEVAAALGMKDKTVSARRTELWHGGHCKPVAMRRMKRQRARVWRLTDTGLVLAGKLSEEKAMQDAYEVPADGRLF